MAEHSGAGGPGCVGGLYEVLIGVEEFGPTARYLAAFGFRPGARGRLSARRARELYGVNSPLESLRLQHGESDHGLYRLMRWKRSTGPGLGMAPFRTAGNRWGASQTRSVMNIMNHVEAARAAGQTLVHEPPIFAVIYQKDDTPGAPFGEPILGVREMNLVRPLTRQVFFERFNYESALYGAVAEDSLMRSSQVTHAGAVICSDDMALPNFYDGVLKLRRNSDTITPYSQAVGAREIFELRPGESHRTVDFDDPRSGPGALRRSGRFKIVQFEEASALRDRRADSRPGALGLCAYTWRVRGIERMREDLRTAGATDVGGVLPDEFGLPALRFRSPDGYAWLLIEDEAWSAAQGA